MDLDFAYNILDILGTMQDAVRQMWKEYEAGNVEGFDSLGMDMQDGLRAVQEVAKQQIPVGSKNRLADACTCVLESLKEIRQSVLKWNAEKMEWKLEYELGAILEEAARQFYYWGIVEAHPEERQNFLDYVADTDMFRDLKKPEEERKVFCDLVILVIGYNKLDYTIRCVQHIKNNLPKGIKTELILFNHGSSDGTKDYFENMEGVKVINVAVNSVVLGAIYKAEARGRWGLVVSNDVLVGENTIDNLVRCVRKHPDYGFVVPSTPAVSNLQTICANYANLEEFLQFARNNNVYDEKRHEQRVRLVNPICIFPCGVFLQMELDLYEDKSCVKAPFMTFPDDKISCWMRRHGYKCILAKDAYCHHYGSVTINSEMDKQERVDRMYLEGRKDFQAHYGVDPWGLGCCFEPELFRNWNIRPVYNACILGINCGLGSNSLKVKEILREKGADDICLINCVQDGRYLEDLSGVSDEVYAFDRLSDIVVKTQRKWYDYIVVEEAVAGYNQEQLVRDILNAGIEFGELAQKAEEGWKIYINSSIGGK